MQARALWAVWRITPLFHGQQPLLGSLAFAAWHSLQALCQATGIGIGIVLRFQQPEDLLRSFDFKISAEPRDLESLIRDCASALYHQVRTGESPVFT